MQIKLWCSCWNDFSARGGKKTWRRLNRRGRSNWFIASRVACANLKQPAQDLLAFGQFVIYHAPPTRPPTTPRIFKQYISRAARLASPRISRLIARRQFIIHINISTWSTRNCLANAEKVAANVNFFLGVEKKICDSDEQISSIINLRWGICGWYLNSIAINIFFNVG